MPTTFSNKLQLVLLSLLTLALFLTITAATVNFFRALNLANYEQSKAESVYLSNRANESQLIPSSAYTFDALVKALPYDSGSAKYIELTPENIILRNHERPANLKLQVKVAQIADRPYFLVYNNASSPD